MKIIIELDASGNDAEYDLAHLMLDRHRDLRDVLHGRVEHMHITQGINPVTTGVGPQPITSYLSAGEMIPMAPVDDAAAAGFGGPLPLVPGAVSTVPAVPLPIAPVASAATLPMPVSEIPPAPIAASIPPAPLDVAPQIPAATAERKFPGRDSAGFPWDERIHASTGTKKKDGTWTRVRGGDEVTYKLVSEELIKLFNIPVAPGVGSAPVITDRPTPQAEATTPYAAFMRRITPHLYDVVGNPAGKLTQQRLTQFVQACGMASVTDLNNSANYGHIPTLDNWIATETA